MPADIVNRAQQEHWDKVVGPKWTGLDEAMERRLRPVSTRLLNAAAARPGEAVLDVGCGTGSTTVPLATAVGEHGSVLGVDISETMLAVARRRVAGLRNVALLLADAQVHGFAAQQFDLIASRFGVMFFEDPVAAFRNLRGALRPGGRLCFVCWAPLADNPHWKLPLDIVARRLGVAPPEPTRAPGPMAFSDAGYVREILGRAGMEAVAIERADLALGGSPPDAEAALACTIGPAGALIAEHQPDAATLAAIRQEIAAAFAGFLNDGVALLPACVFVVTARPG